MLRLFRNLLFLEIVAAVTVIGIVTAILSKHLVVAQEETEKANVEFTISSVRSALRMQIANMLVHGTSSHYAKLAGINPFDLLERKPANYGGELSENAVRNAVPGIWYFDLTTRTLIYWVKHGNNFQPYLENEKKIQLRIELLHDKALEQKFGKAVVTGVRLVPISTYKWR